jgi:glycosyltransferase involved in cell wall biosynthesis
MKHRSMVKKSKKIIAISKFVKSDILKNFPRIENNKVVVIPNAVVMSEETTVPEGIKPPFLMCVSDHGIHKNHLTLLKAYNIIKNKIPHRLVLLGGVREETPTIVGYINDNGLGDKVDLISKIPDAERNWFYKNTDLMISPSMHEGFGRTPVEAAMLGAMVLTSRETSLPEVTFEMLNYYAPATDEKVLGEKILDLLAHPTPEKERKQIAKTFKELYDPVRIAESYYELFCNIVNDKK